MIFYLLEQDNRIHLPGFTNPGSIFCFLSKQKISLPVFISSSTYLVLIISFRLIPKTNLIFKFFQLEIKVF